MKCILLLGKPFDHRILVRLEDKFMELEMIKTLTKITGNILRNLGTKDFKDG